MGKHAKAKFGVAQEGDQFKVVFTATGNQVPGTPWYKLRRHAEGHAARLNERVG